ncbi:MAG: CheA signal transduction histidine kinase, partial [Gemmataceae bacterium]|nr:CheA signal transduction histidine kinase [Gemmataceae bacterium]
AATTTSSPPAPRPVEPAAAADPPPRPVEPTAADLPPPPKAAPADPGPAVAGAAESNVRVDVGLLDKLMNLVGELVLTRNQILQYAPIQKDAGFLNTAQRLNLITTELQEGVMKTRMQPIGTVWNRFPRVVRDLAAVCGKQVRVEMEGQTTELDRTIIEAIKDPLTHIVRNSVDHGIEPPDARIAAGKPAEGRLHLRAFHEGGQVNIEITDDGDGIRPDRVRAKAVSRGLVDPDRAARMTDAELCQLIFLPGFSTAETVTNVSGRGVGMDVVKTNIEKIGGAVDLHSRPGEGTTLRIKIPLTLAIIPALVVTCGGDRYAIPQASLLELVRLDGDAARGRVESFQGAPVYRLRGNLLPLVYLHDLLRVDPRPAGDAVTVVVLRADGRTFGLIVDGTQDTEEIVVKPMGKLLQHLTLFAGATIMGDGRIALILDVPGVARQARVVTGRDRVAAEKPAPPAEARADLHTMLLVGLGPDRRLAVPLARVARLEEIPAAAVEWADGDEVVRYRGEILPLARLYDLLGGGGEPPPAGDTLQLVVVSDGGRSVGLVVGRVLDIIETELAATRGARRPGLVGSAVIQDRVTDVVDVRAVIELAAPAGV